MDGSIIGRCRFGCKTLSILICKDTKHSDICSQICSRFKELQVDEHSSCLLETDMDVRVLHLSLCNENINAVDINVIRGGGKVFGNGEQDKMDSSDSEGNTSTDENEYLGKYAAKEGRLYLSHEWKTYIREAGKKYECGVTEFRIKLCKYAFEKGFRFIYVKNDLKRVTAKCLNKQSENCPWRVHATVNLVNGFFYIKYLMNEHTCKECDANSSRFERLFISYHASIEGFKFCRPFLCLDGTFVKNKYKGHMLAATGKNGNQGFFPLAFAIVDSKNEANWTWFLDNLSDILSPQGRNITFISDRCKGLLEGIQNVCAYAPTKEAFNHHMKKLQKDGGTTILEFLDTIPNENWSNAFFPGKKYGEMCSNLVEWFNSWIVVEHKLPIFQLFERLQKAVDIGRHWDVSRSSEHVFEVRAEYSFVIDIQQCTCSCHQWQLNGFPCAHAIAAILADYDDPYDYFEPYFIADYYRNCYDIPIVPDPDVEKESPEGLEDFIVKPPLTKKPPGRPRTKRIKSSVEDRRANKCSQCGHASQHNRKTCNHHI
ncbi:unnamed protein product [Prunus armeniaca]